MYDGILLINKESGWSSFDVVAKVRGTLRNSDQSPVISDQQEQNTENGLQTTSSVKPKIKVGHTGTLDPLATGLMIVVVGSYCKRANEFSKLDKVYEVQMKLGEISTTGDEEGTKTKVKSEKFKEEKIIETLKSFVGVTSQTPPAFSAIKIDGKRAYKLACEGKEVKIEPREITIYDIDLKKYDFPFVDFTVHVGSGTYVRSLVEDIGKKLGTGAYMSALTRTKVGKYNIEDAIKVEDVVPGKLRKIV